MTDSVCSEPPALQTSSSSESKPEPECFSAVGDFFSMKLITCSSIIRTQSRRIRTSAVMDPVVLRSQIYQTAANNCFHISCCSLISVKASAQVLSPWSETNMAFQLLPTALLTGRWVFIFKYLQTGAKSGSPSWNVQLKLWAHINPGLAPGPGSGSGPGPDFVGGWCVGILSSITHTGLLSYQCDFGASMLLTYHLLRVFNLYASSGQLLRILNIFFIPRW